MAEYNGWTNKATWLVNVWYNPESDADVAYAKEELTEQLNTVHGGICSGCAYDMLNDTLNDINWEELKEHCDGGT